MEPWFYDRMKHWWDEANLETWDYDYEVYGIRECYSFKEVNLICNTIEYM